MRALGEQAGAAGVAFLDAPVSGNVRARNEGTLAVMAGGDAAAFERVKPVLDTIGANVFLLGPVGAGSIAKIANNLIGLTTLVTAMEGMLLGIRQGLGGDELRDVIMTASGACPAVLGVAHQHRTRRYRHEGPPQAAIRIVIKDLELAVELGAEAGLPVRTAAAALESFRAAAAAGRSEAELWMLLDHLEQAGQPTTSG
jgi:3-hydroxyisobutyrate dehydrogenase-like beta-hydroxyacid dehydrogenase